MGKGYVGQFRLVKVKTSTQKWKSNSNYFIALLHYIIFIRFLHQGDLSFDKIGRKRLAIVSSGPVDNAISQFMKFAKKVPNK